MNIDELNTWILSDEGKAWADGLKQPLIAKRDSLLAELTKGNARSAEALQRSADSDRILADERAALKKIVLDDQLERLLSDTGVPELIRPSVTAALLSVNDVRIEANGLERKAVVKGKDETGQAVDLDLKSFVQAWAKTDEAKHVCVIPPSSGGGSQGGAGKGTGPRSVDLDTFNAMNAEARMDFTRKGGTIQ